MFIFKSCASDGAHLCANYFFIAASVFIAWDIYVWLGHGHIIGGVFMAGICLLIALIARSFKGQVLVSRASYKAQYKIAGMAFNFEYPFATYRVLQVEYDCFHSMQADRHPKVLQFYLLPSVHTEKAFGVSLLADIYFDQGHQAEEVVEFIARFINASGVELLWSDGPLEKIKELYSKHPTNGLAARAKSELPRSS